MHGAVFLYAICGYVGYWREGVVMFFPTGEGGDALRHVWLVMEVVMVRCCGEKCEGMCGLGTFARV